MRDFAEASGPKLGKVAQPLRAALTGKAVSPPVFDVMAVLGREEALARIRDQARMNWLSLARKLRPRVARLAITLAHSLAAVQNV